MIRKVFLERLNSKGQHVVEVTLIFLLLVLLVGAAVDWGLAFFVSHALQNGVREAARTAVTQNTMARASAAAKAEVQRRIPDVGLFTEFRDSATVTVTCECHNSSGNVVPCNPTASLPPLPFITVQTTGWFNFYFMRLLGLQSTMITRFATMRYERLLQCPA